MKIVIFMKNYFIYLPSELKNIIFNFALNNYFIDNYCNKYRKLYKNFKYEKCHNRQLTLYNNWFIHVKKLPSAIYTKLGDYVIHEKEYIDISNIDISNINKVKIFKIAGYYSVNSFGMNKFITPKLEDLSLSIEEENKKNRYFLLVAFYQIENYFNEKDKKYKIYRDLGYNDKSTFTIHPIEEYKIIDCKYFKISNY